MEIRLRQSALVGKDNDNNALHVVSCTIFETLNMLFFVALAKTASGTVITSPVPLYVKSSAVSYPPLMARNSRTMGRDAAILQYYH